METQNNTSITSPTVGCTIKAYQAGFPDHASPAGDDFVRGNLAGDVQLPKGPVRDQTVMDWEEFTEPRLSLSHDVVGRALSSFFTTKGGWVYLTQDMIGAAARVSRQIANRALRDLEEVGRLERREMKTNKGHRGYAYRLTGEDTKWEPTLVGMDRRTTVAHFKKDMRILELEKGILALAELVPADQALSSSLIKLVDGINPSGREVKSDFLRRMEKLNGSDKGALSSKLVDSALDTAAQVNRTPVTESQLVEIIANQERTGLSEDDIKASWPDINPGTEPPLYMELLSKSRGFRVVAWLRKQPDALVPELVAEVPCTCAEIAQAMKNEASPEAQEMWAGTLEVLAEELPVTTFDTSLKETEGLRCDGKDLMVRVPSLYAVARLEQRMYQTILRALRGRCGPEWDVRFQAPESSLCALHGSSGPGKPAG